MDLAKAMGAGAATGGSVGAIGGLPGMASGAREGVPISDRKGRIRTYVVRERKPPSGVKR